ncbi:hypothetical protein [Deinococcus sp.]|uniref:hypothetical protein n=1 Tax=Deinococcus sp. TaxID=47478 RepID=UPI003B593A73
MDSSDSNDDVAVVLVSQNEFIPYIIYLSLVGDIAYIAALRPDTENAEVLKLLTDTLDSLDWQFALKDDLYRKSPFPTDIAGDSATIFNALFCDGYMMPNL